MNPATLVLLSKAAYLVAALGSFLLGINGKPAVLSIVAGAVVFTVGYFLARVGQINRLVTVDGKNPIGLFLFLSVFHCILSGALYGLGRLFS